MRDSFYKKLSIYAGLFVIAVTFALAIFISNIEIKDLDLWLHIGMGRYIVANGFHVPNVDVLSCTISGQHWVNHEWLFQVVVYFIHSWFGTDGLINMQVVLVALTMFILLFMGYNKEKQLASIFCLLLTSLVYHSRFTTRPDLYSLLFFALYILLLSFFIDKKWSLYVLFFVQLLWTNMHGFFFFGPLFVLIGIFAEFLKRRVRLPYEWNNTGRLTDEEYKRLKNIFFVVVFACIFNPMTFKGAWYPIKVFFSLSGGESKIFFEKIIELQRPFTRDTLFTLGVYRYYKLLILLSFASFVYNRRKIDIGVLLFWLVFLFFSLSAVRNLVFFAFAAYLVFVTNALSISMRDILPIRVLDKKFIHILSIFVKILLVLWVLQYFTSKSANGYYDFDKYEKKSEFGGVSLRQYPSKAVDFLVENNVKGNFFNDFNSGAYMIGRCFPNIKVFIDGRTEVYGPKFFKYYQKIWEKDDVDVFAEALDRYNITGALLSSVHQPIPDKALNLLQKSEEWIPVYFNYDGVIYLKDVPLNKNIIKKHHVDLENWRAPSLDRFRVGPRNITPYQHIWRAFTLENLGFDDAAMSEINEAVKTSPNYRLSYRLLGKIYAKREDYLNAFENFRIAAMLDQKHKETRLNLALSYHDLAEYTYAAKQFERIINLWPSDAKAYFLLAKTYLKQEEYSKAVKITQAAFARNMNAIEDVLKIGDLMGDNGRYEEAKVIFELGLGSKKKLEKVYLKLGYVYKKLGDPLKAKEYFEKVLEKEPNNKKVVEVLKELQSQNSTKNVLQEE